MRVVGLALGCWLRGSELVASCFPIFCRYALRLRLPLESGSGVASGVTHRERERGDERTNRDQPFYLYRSMYTYIHSTYTYMYIVTCTHSTATIHSICRYSTYLYLDHACIQVPVELVLVRVPEMYYVALLYISIVLYIHVST